MNTYDEQILRAMDDRERVRRCGTETTWETSAPLFPPQATPALIRELWPNLEAAK